MYLVLNIFVLNEHENNKVNAQKVFKRKADITYHKFKL